MIPAEYQPFFVIGVILLLFFLIYKSVFRASVSFLIAIVILLVFGILESKEILIGFSNDKIASIILLILISAGLRKNFNIEYFFDKVFQKAKTYRGFLVQMMAQVAAMSAIVNNAPVVALMSPYVVGWGKRKGISPSKLLIPLSFATIMGGMLTVIGTSTTLLLNGFLTSNNISTIKPTDLLIIGAMVTITGILFFVTIGHKLLPNRADLIDTFKEHEREYLVEVRLEQGSSLTGKTVQEANLRNMEGMFLVEILRANHVMSPVRPEEILEDGDSLVFAGDTDKVINLVDSDSGLSLPKQSGQLSKQFSLVECVLSNGSSIIGKTIREAEFRNRYDAAVVAIHRNAAQK